MIEIDMNLIREMLKNGKRLDNRQMEEYRKIHIETGIIQQAEGSSRVRLGNTEVIAGVKMGLGKPYPDSPDEGVLSVAAELVQFASPEFESGPPGEQSIELARVVDRCIRESKMIDTEKLCVKEKEHVWMVYVDLDVINDDGNLIDTACLAAVAALLSTKIPTIEWDGETPTVNIEKRSGKLPIRGVSVTTTFVKIGSSIVSDPGLTEIGAADARLSIGSLENKLCSMQKGGSYGFTIEEIEKLADLALEKGDELRKHLEQIVMD
jgi:exosome complex component RRP42